MLKKIVVIPIILSFCLLIFSGCQSNITRLSPDQNDTANFENKIPLHKIKIITTLFPQYDFARQITGKFGDVQPLITFGQETHNYTPTADDIERIKLCDIFIYSSDYMDPWVKDVISTLGDKPKVLNVSEGITFDLESGLQGTEISTSSSSETTSSEPENTPKYDPHIWTSPINAQVMLNNTLSVILEYDPVNAEYYNKNAYDYDNKIKNLDTKIKDLVSTSKRKEIIFAGKFPLHYFVKEYGLEYKAGYDYCNIENDITQEKIFELEKEIKDNSIPVIYTVELTSFKNVNAISKDTGAKVLMFQSFHNISKAFNNDASYVSLMDRNIEILKEGLN